MQLGKAKSGWDGFGGVELPTFPCPLPFPRCCCCCRQLSSPRTGRWHEAREPKDLRELGQNGEDPESGRKTEMGTDPSHPSIHIESTLLLGRPCIPVRRRQMEKRKSFIFFPEKID